MKRIKYFTFGLLSFLSLVTPTVFGQAKLAQDSTAGTNLQSSPNIQWSRNLLYGKQMYYIFDAKTGKTLAIYPAQLVNYIFLGKDEAANLYQAKGIYVATEADPTVPSYSKSLTNFSVIKSSTDPLYSTPAQLTAGLAGKQNTIGYTPANINGTNAVGVWPLSITGSAAQLNGHADSYFYQASNPAGYISSYSETDPTIPAYVKTISSFTVIQASTDLLYLGKHAVADNASQLGGNSPAYYYPASNPNNYISSYAETDPNVPAYSKSLTSFSIIQSSTDPLYLALHGTADNSGKLGGNLPSYYYAASNPNNYQTPTSTASFTNKNLNDATNTFPIFNQSTTGNAATATTSSQLNGQLPAYYLNYANLTNKPTIYSFTGTVNQFTDGTGAYQTIKTSLSQFTNDVPFVTGLTIYPAYGFTGSVGGTSTNPILTVSTTVADGQMIRSQGGEIIAATPGTDFVSPAGSYTNPSWITSLPYSKITGAPTNVSSFTNDVPYTTPSSSYYIGTTLNTLNRSSATQTLTGISIDGHATLDVPYTGATGNVNIGSYSLTAGGITSSVNSNTPSNLISVSNSNSGTSVQVGYQFTVNGSYGNITLNPNNFSLQTNIAGSMNFNNSLQSPGGGFTFTPSGGGIVIIDRTANITAPSFITSGSDNGHVVLGNGTTGVYYASPITALTGDGVANGPGSSVLTLSSSGVTAGTYTYATVNVDAKGRVTSATNGTQPVTSFSIASANGLAGTLGGTSAVPIITLSTSITGVVKANGASFSAAVDGTDYISPTDIFYLGTTSIVHNRVSASQPLTGITSIDGTSAAWTTARTLAGNSVNGSANVPFTNKFIVQGTSDAGLSGAQFTGALATGIVKNTTTTGVFSIASVGSDYVAPTSTFYIGTTSIAFNRASAAQTLTGISIDGHAGSDLTSLNPAFTGTLGGPIGVFNTSLRGGPATGGLVMQSFTGNATFGALYPSTVTASSTNYILYSDGTTINHFNAPTNLYLEIGGTVQASLTSSGLSVINGISIGSSGPFRVDGSGNVYFYNSSSGGNIIAAQGGLSAVNTNTLPANAGLIQARFFDATASTTLTVGMDKFVSSGTGTYTLPTPGSANGSYMISVYNKQATNSITVSGTIYKNGSVTSVSIGPGVYAEFYSDTASWNYR